MNGNKNKFLELLERLNGELEKKFADNPINLNILHHPEPEILKDLSIDTITLSIANENTQSIDLFRNSIIQSKYLQDGMRFFDYPLSKYNPANSKDDFRDIIDLLFIIRRSSQKYTEELPEYYNWLEKLKNSMHDKTAGNSFIVKHFDPGRLLFYFICYKYCLIKSNKKEDLKEEYVIIEGIKYLKKNDFIALEEYRCNETSNCKHIRYSEATSGNKCIGRNNCKTFYGSIDTKFNKFRENCKLFFKKNYTIDKLFKRDVKKYSLSEKNLFNTIFDEIIPKKSDHYYLLKRSIISHLFQNNDTPDGESKTTFPLKKIKDEAYLHFTNIIRNKDASASALATIRQKAEFSLPLLYLQFIYSGLQPFHLLWMPVWEENVVDTPKTDQFYVFKKYPLMSLITIRATKENIITKCEPDIKKLNIVIQGIYLNLIRDYYYGHLREQKDIELRKHATRAAISQLYARTDAHDLSHVLDAYQSEEDFAFNEENGQYVFKDHNNSILDELKRKKVRLQGFFNHFLQTRMVFRADVATTDPNSLTTLDFYKDIFLPFNNNLIFNNRISGINDKNLKYKFTVKAGTNTNSDVDIQVAIPNDVLGCQAMYIIWSNVIRNTVKHGDLKMDSNAHSDEKGNLEFTIDINEYEQNPDYYEIKFHTNVYRESNKINDLVTNRNKDLDKTILESETNRLRDNALGSIEMDTCAAYLRKMPVTEVENDIFSLFDKNRNFMEGKPYQEGNKYTPMILYAYSNPKEDVGDWRSLGYKFFLMKPKEVIIVSDNPKDLIKSITDDKKKELLKNGIEFINTSDIKAQTFNHNFLVYLGPEANFKNYIKVNKILLSSLPKRKLFYSEASDFNISNNAKNIIRNCWKKWIAGFNRTYEIYAMSNADSKGNVERIFPSPNDSINGEIKIKAYIHDDKLVQVDDDQTIIKLEDGAYHEMICGHHWANRKLLGSISDPSFWLGDDLIKFPYLESVFTNVLILDERIQRSIVLQEKKYRGKIPFTAYFKQQGILIPNPNCKIKTDNEKEPNLNDVELYQHKACLKNYISANANKVGFVIIHLGILEKLLDNKEVNKNSKEISKVINSIINKKHRSKIIITSGRGKPNNVAEEYPFLPISLLQNAIDTSFDKYRLIQLLYNSRKVL